MTLDIITFTSAGDARNSDTHEARACAYLRRCWRGIPLIACVWCWLLVPIPASAANVFVSADGAASWTGALTTTNDVKCVVADLVNPTTVYVCSRIPNGIVQSLDGGATWSTILSSRNVTSLAISPSDDNVLVAGTDSSLTLISLDQGQSWSIACSCGGMALVFDPADGNTIYSAGGSVVWVSTDAGGHWTSHSIGGGTTWALAVDPNTPGLVYAGTDSGVFASSDVGSTWSSIGFFGTGHKVLSIVVDPNTPGTLYAGTDKFPGDGAVFVTNDGGATWSENIVESNTEPVSALVISPDSQTLFAGIIGQGIYSSGDGGMTWSESDSGLTSFKVSSLALVPTTPLTLFAGTLNGCTVRC